MCTYLYDVLGLNCCARNAVRRRWRAYSCLVLIFIQEVPRRTNNRGLASNYINDNNQAYDTHKYNIVMRIFPFANRKCAGSKSPEHSILLWFLHIL